MELLMERNDQPLFSKYVLSCAFLLIRLWFLKVSEFLGVLLEALAGLLSHPALLVVLHL